MQILKGDGLEVPPGKPVEAAWKKCNKCKVQLYPSSSDLWTCCHPLLCHWSQVFPRPVCHTRVYFNGDSCHKFSFCYCCQNLLHPILTNLLSSTAIPYQINLYGSYKPHNVDPQYSIHNCKKWSIIDPRSSMGGQ